MIVGVLVLLILPMVMAGIVAVLNRWPFIAALLSVLTCLGLGGLALTLATDQPLSFLGREFRVEPEDKFAIAFLFFSAAMLFLLSWRFAPRSMIFPVGLGLLGLLSGALLIRPLIYAVLLVEIAVALSIFALQITGHPPTRGGIRYLIFAVLALPGLLITHWLLDRYILTPDDTQLLTMATALLAFSFALLLGVVPFHTWVPAMTRDSLPMASAFVLTISNGVIWFLLLDFLALYPWLTTQYGGVGSIAMMAGLAMVVVGGVLSPAQMRFGSLLGYAVLVDSGVTLMALGFGDQMGMTLVVLSLLVRPLGVFLYTAGLSGLRRQGEGFDDFDVLRGAGWKAPWSTVALVLGILSIAGLPVSAGFGWRWAFYRVVGTAYPGLALVTLLATLGIVAGLWRGLNELLMRPPAPKDRSVVAPKSEGRVTAIVVSLAVLLCVVGGLFPQVFATTASHLADAYTFVMP